MKVELENNQPRIRILRYDTMLSQPVNLLSSHFINSGKILGGNGIFNGKTGDSGSLIVIYDADDLAGINRYVSERPQ